MLVRLLCFCFILALTAPANAALYRFDATFDFELSNPANGVIGPFSGSGSFVFDTADAALATSKRTLVDAPVTDLSFSISPQPIDGIVFDAANTGIDLQFGDTNDLSLNFVEFEASEDSDNLIRVRFTFPVIDFAALDGQVPSAAPSADLRLDAVLYVNALPAAPATGTLVATLVPEPASLALLGPIGIMMMARRRHR